VDQNLQYFDGHPRTQLVKRVHYILWMSVYAMANTKQNTCQLLAAVAFLYASLIHKG
jgi:hypothetical protein